MTEDADMGHDSCRRFLFVCLVCLLSVPWLTPCVGIWSAAAVSGVHDAVAKPHDVIARLPGDDLKKWAANPPPKLTLLTHRTISSSEFVREDEVDAAHGGSAVPPPGTLAGRGTSMVVKGVAETLTWVDPFTWMTQNAMDPTPDAPQRHVVLCESPYVVLSGLDIRVLREGKNGRILLARARSGTVHVITPQHALVMRGGVIHFRAPNHHLVIEQPTTAHIGADDIAFGRGDAVAKLDFSTWRLECRGDAKIEPSFFARGRRP